MVDSGNVIEVRLRPVRSYDDRPVELCPASAELTNDEGADRIGIGHHAVVRQTLQPPGEGNCARRKEAVAELECRERLHNVAHSVLHEMRPDATKCSRRST